MKYSEIAVYLVINLRGGHQHRHLYLCHGLCLHGLSTDFCRKKRMYCTAAFRRNSDRTIESTINVAQTCRESLFCHLSLCHHLCVLCHGNHDHHRGASFHQQFYDDPWQTQRQFLCRPSRTDQGGPAHQRRPGGRKTQRRRIL